jgi:hypothetical protein
MSYRLWIFYVMFAVWIPFESGFAKSPDERDVQLTVPLVRDRLLKIKSDYFKFLDKKRIEVVAATKPQVDVLVPSNTGGRIYVRQGEPETIPTGALDAAIVRVLFHALDADSIGSLRAGIGKTIRNEFSDRQDRPGVERCLDERILHLGFGESLAQYKQWVELKRQGSSSSSAAVDDKLSRQIKDRFLQDQMMNQMKRGYSATEALRFARELEVYFPLNTEKVKNLDMNKAQYLWMHFFRLQACINDFSRKMLILPYRTSTEDEGRLMKNLKEKKSRLTVSNLKEFLIRVYANP